MYTGGGRLGLDRVAFLLLFGVDRLGVALEHGLDGVVPGQDLRIDQVGSDNDEEAEREEAPEPAVEVAYIYKHVS